MKTLYLMILLTLLAIIYRVSSVHAEQINVISKPPVITKVGDPKGPPPGILPIYKPPTGCIASDHIPPTYDEFDYPRDSGGVTTCGPTSGAMVLTAAEVLQATNGKSAIEKVTTDWERLMAWDTGGFKKPSAIAAAINNIYAGQVKAEGFQDEKRVTSADTVRGLIRQTHNPVMVSAYYDNNSVTRGLKKDQTAGVKGDTNGGISLVDSPCTYRNGESGHCVGHMVAVWQVCSDRVYLNDPVFGEQYSVPKDQFNTAINTDDSRGEAVSVMSLNPRLPETQLKKPTSGKIELCFKDIEPPYGPNHPHKGIDISNVQGTQIVAAERGTVVAASRDPDGSGSRGNYVIIYHPLLGIYTHYFHLEPIVFVPVDSPVARGELIGLMDKSGDATGFHLHFAVSHNLGVSPDYIPDYFDPALYFGLPPETECKSNGTDF